MSEVIHVMGYDCTHPCHLFLTSTIEDNGLRKIEALRVIRSGWLVTTSPSKWASRSLL